MNIPNLQYGWNDFYLLEELLRVPILNEYRLLGDKVIRNHIRGMDYGVVGYRSTSLIRKYQFVRKGDKAANSVRSCTVVCNKDVKCGERISEA